MTKHNIAIVGAGFTGLTAAYDLSKNGHRVTVFEKHSQLGGLGVGFQETGWEWPLDCYYHHWFSNDKTVLRLAHELNYPLIQQTPRTSVWMHQHIHDLDNVKSVLKFQHLNLGQRIRMLGGLACLRFNPYWRPLEAYGAHHTLPRLVGKHAYKTLWEPLLAKKFSHHYHDISLAWFWGRIYKRTKKLFYPKGGFLQFAQHLADKASRQGAKIQVGISVEQIAKHQQQFALNEGSEKFDKVIVTLPNQKLHELYPTLPADYQQKLLAMPPLLGAVVLILRLSKPFLTDNVYWLNYADMDVPLLAVIEHTHFIEKRYYNNEHIVYLAHYLPTDHPWFHLTAEELRLALNATLLKIAPHYQENLIGCHLFKTAYAQPVIGLNYSRMILPLQTPVQNLYLANQQQIYPWDRGTNYAVELGKRVAKEIS